VSRQERGAWGRLARGVSRHARPVWIATVLALAVLCVYIVSLRRHRSVQQGVLPRHAGLDVLFGFGGSDASLPLFVFIFLVALGVDYNIVLMTRVREEAAQASTRDAVVRGSR
jgi:uncharacterized membrane protein YdfJ with MMPL/SSD domain